MEFIDIIDMNHFNSKENALYYACQNENYKMIENLLNSNIKIDLNRQNYHGWTSFHLVCYREYIDIIKLFLEDERIDVNKQDYDGWTPFHYICFRGHENVIKLFLTNKRIRLNIKSISDFWGYQAGTTCYDILRKKNINIDKIV